MASQRRKTKQLERPALTKVDLSAHDVDISLVDQPVFLMKVPEVLYDVLHAAAERDQELARVEVKLPPNKKRIGTLKVSAEVFEGMDPEDVSAIPKAFDIRFEEPMGHRVFTEGPDGKTALVGIVTDYANVMPDIKDQAYAKYARNQHESRFKVEKKVAGVLNADEAPRPKDDFVGVMAVRNVEREKELEELNAAGFLGAFERKKYISVDLLQEIFPKRTRADLRRHLREHCDYIRSGPNHGTYVLKGFLRGPEDIIGVEDDADAYEEATLPTARK